MTKPEAAIALLLDGLDEAFERHSWHGPNLRGSVRGLSAEDAAWRPGAGRHNIWEIVVHAAYWKYGVRRLITGAKRGAFAYRGSNWFARQEASPAAWRRDLDLLAREHAMLREAVADLPAAHLNRVSPKKRYTYAGVIRGVAAHDVYHAGQIQLLKRMRK